MCDNILETDWPDLFFDSPDPNCQRMTDFRRWLRDNQNLELVLYHGTSAEFPVLEQGLLPTSTRRRNSLQSSTGFVSLSVFQSSARQFAEIAFPNRKVIVYGVRLCIRRLRPDKDQLRNKRMWAQLILPNTLAHSLVFGYGAWHRGKIDKFHLFDSAQVTQEQSCQNTSSN